MGQQVRTSCSYAVLLFACFNVCAPVDAQEGPAVEGTECTSWSADLDQNGRIQDTGNCLYGQRAIGFAGNGTCPRGNTRGNTSYTCECISQAEANGGDENFKKMNRKFVRKRQVRRAGWVFFGFACLIGIQIAVWCMEPKVGDEQTLAGLQVWLVVVLLMIIIFLACGYSNRNAFDVRETPFVIGCGTRADRSIYGSDSMLPASNGLPTPPPGISGATIAGVVICCVLVIPYLVKTAKSINHKRRIALREKHPTDTWVLEGDSDFERALYLHNKLRERHDAPPLEWDDELAEYAERAAKENETMGRMNHCFLEKDGDCARMGQNLAWCSMGIDAVSSTEMWYSEVDNPGYDYKRHGFSMGTGHFTQVVWKGTRKIGMAVSPNGCFVAANYFPPGNSAQSFSGNVLPRGVDPSNGDSDTQKTKPCTSTAGVVMIRIDGLDGGETTTDQAPAGKPATTSRPVIEFDSYSQDNDTIGLFTI